MKHVEIICEFRKGFLTALLERVDDLYRVSYVRRLKSLDKAEGEFLAFVPPTQHETYKKQIADKRFTQQNSM